MLEKFLNIWKPLLSYSRSQSPLWERNVLSSSVTKQGLGNESRTWWLMKQKSALTVSTVSRFIKSFFSSGLIIRKIIFMEHVCKK